MSLFYYIQCSEVSLKLYFEVLCWTGKETRIEARSWTFTASIGAKVLAPESTKTASLLRGQLVASFIRATPLKSAPQQLS